MAAGGQHRNTTLAWLVAALVHLGLLGIWQGSDKEDQSDAGSEVLAAVDLSSVELVALPSPETEIAGALLTSIAGASDLSGADSAEAMRDWSDAPGTSLGSRAPGATGPQNFADRSDPSHRSASPWNTDGPSVMPHTGETPRGTHSAESLERSRLTGFSDQEKREKLARAGASEAVSGVAEGQGEGGAPGTRGEEWLALDPRFDSAPSEQREFVGGAIRLNDESALKDRGSETTEHANKGRAEESFLSPNRSNRTEVSAFHLGAPTTGAGKSSGAGGKSGRSTASHEGRGTAAQSGHGSAAALASTRASRSDPYFYEMYRRIDKELRFPKKLALALEQGDLVLSFHLDKEGRVRSLKIAKGSGFQEFDTEAVRAFRAAAPFGAVPDALLRSRDRVQVVAPYYFRNPLIR